ncbi:AraC family transcriptional regulator [Paracoccus sp. SCSIO 75233]|uniref:AraC family transcriptional regulator n=1 Tax=Paracoccus sp. SCSIO 75233 TaxID=3017782 RepID=UPI0022F0B8F5|nr:AraC family transcriptional regulator [Paracoccus sp. SCSIO 75233]WBU53342.1 AraC family transcriptional regulator ligand-binding domain-containing protein [Paracoccus sp. SCSIO 75233]
MTRQYIRARSLTGLRELAAQHGGDLRAVLTDVGLDPALLGKAEELIDFSAYCRLLEHCAELWRLPDLGFRMAPYHHLEILGPVALVTRMERNFRNAVLAILDNLVVYTNMLVASLEEQDDVAALILSVRSQPQSARQYIMLALAVSRNVIEQAAGHPVQFLEATFSEEDGGTRRTAEALFACPVRFGVERTALYFDRAVLDLELERSDTAYHAIIQRYLSTERASASRRISDVARNEIARQMELAECTLESVAHALRMEPRSLQRRLKAEGTSFRELVDEWRRERAMSLVTMTRMPLSDVADALGYAHQAVFSRAFLRWYGHAPLSYRQRVIGMQEAS